MGTATRRLRGLLPVALRWRTSIAGDGAFGDADGGAGGAAEDDGAEMSPMVAWGMWGPMGSRFWP